MSQQIKLSDFNTDAPLDANKLIIKKKVKTLAEEIADYQHILTAEGEKSLLVIFQGMDASGKDGATRNIFGRCGPSGIASYSFKKPTEEEFAHDFLWRVHKIVPKKGEIVIFNRSHYEDILIQRVHKWIDEERVNTRIDAINTFEKLLEIDNRTRILKFYMHISKDRQKEKLQERIDIPRKNWKHNPADWEERKLWKDYMFTYEEAINRCSKVPWIIVPCDKRWYRNYIIGQHVLQTLKEMNPVLPGLQS